MGLGKKFLIIILFLFALNFRAFDATKHWLGIKIFRYENYGLLRCNAVWLDIYAEVSEVFPVSHLESRNVSGSGPIRP